MKTNEHLKGESPSLQSCIAEALDRFNGYWANDYTVCDTIADKHNLNRMDFKNAVYSSIHRRSTVKKSKQEQGLN